jgi:hypothetical protein
MRIESIEIDNQEMREAVQEWLLKKGLDIIVKKVDHRGYPVIGYEVVCDLKAQPETKQPELV